MQHWLKNVVYPAVACGSLTGLATAIYCLNVGLPPSQPVLMVPMPTAQARVLSNWVQSEGILPRNCVVEFGGFQCPYCRKATVEVRVLKQEFAARAHFVFGQFPLAGHQFATQAAIADLIARKFGKEQTMFGWLMASDDLRLNSIQLEMVKLGIPKSVLSGRKVVDATNKEIKGSQSVGEELGVESIPSFYYLDSKGRLFHALSLDALHSKLAKL